MTLQVLTNLFTYEDLSAVVRRLLLLDEELDQMLSEYQSNARRGEIERLKASCEPLCLLQGLVACLTDDSGEIETVQDFRGIQLEDEFFKCETVDWQIDSWSGVENANEFAGGPHPWLSDQILARFPAELAACYESVLSSYFSILGIVENRREAWNFWSKNIFNVRTDLGAALPPDDDAKWQDMQRAYFNSSSARKEFLNNLLAAIRNPGGNQNDFSDQREPDPSVQCLYGFVYFVRNGDLHKIGITENLLRRLGELQPDEVLNVVRCKNFQDVERKLHSQFKEIRLPQTEYFRMDSSHILETHRLLSLLAEI